MSVREAGERDLAEALAEVGTPAPSAPAPPAAPSAWSPRRQWEVQACVSIALVGDAADLARDRRLAAGEPAARVAADHARVTRKLDGADDYVRRWSLPWTWWRATRVTAAWGYINAAKVALVTMLDDRGYAAHQPANLAVIRQFLPADDPRRERVEQASAGPPTHEDRDATASALRAAYERMAADYHHLRRFQSTVLGSAMAILAVVGALVVIGIAKPEVVPLCFPDPSAELELQAAEGTPDGTVCPSAEPPSPTAEAGATAEEAEQAAARAARSVRPSAGDVGTVLLFGLMGAALTSVAFVVRKGPRTGVPVNGVRASQAVLKAATGMLTALLGILFLRAGVVPGFTRVDTRSQILVYAVVFGAAQELVTRFIDHRSNELVTAVTTTTDEPPDDEERPTPRSRPSGG